MKVQFILQIGADRIPALLRHASQRARRTWGLAAIWAMSAAAPALAACPPTPDTSCHFSQAAMFAYADSADDAKDKLSFKFSKGANAQVGDFGDPTTADSYDVCLYPDGAPPYAMAIAVDGDCSDKACWMLKAKGPTFKDRSGTPNGITGIKLAAPKDASDKTQVVAKGKGANLPDLVLPMAEPLTVQVRNTLGNCWGAVFAGPEQLTQDTIKAKVKGTMKAQVIPSCTDAQHNGYETALDCGGGCAPCPFGQSCLVGSDCQSGICATGACSAKRVFVTSTSYAGNFGGLASADAICNARAAAAAVGGTWTAWLSDSSTNAIDRIVDQEYRTMDGFVVVANKAQISGTGVPTWGIERNEFNVDTPAVWAWTGTNDYGNAILSRCNDWTTNSNLSQGWVGWPATPANWSAYGQTTCDTGRRLVCFEN